MADIRDRLNTALQKGKLEKALGLYEQLIADSPDEARWPHRRGDLLLRMGRKEAALASFEVAVDLYARSGFIARAAAMAKVVMGLDPDRGDVLERVDPAAAQALRQRHGPPSKSGKIRSAPLLEPAPDAGDDEVRFTEAESQMLTLDLSELEVMSKPPPPPEAEEPPDPTASLLAQLPAMPLFSDVSRETLAVLLGDSEHVIVPDGEALLKTGEASDALYVITSGHADVHVPGLHHPIPVDEGDVIGETCLLDDVQRRADVVARGDLEALRLPKAVLDACVKEDPALEGLLLELLGRRLLTNLMKTSPIFAGFDPSTRVELAKLFEIRRADEGTVLLEKGKRGDGLFVVLLGEIETDEEVAKAGGVFGHASLLTREPSEVGAVAKTDALLLRMPARRFNELAALYPPALMAISELAQSDDAVYPGTTTT
ncbi:MAG: cyclic nucleotide-binding domain-containing protein [Deltaproteobacteria bacterium]|nr:cyclic nucleotide-binding domain-containing protein [Deltaproteobacteria bacterium]